MLQERCEARAPQVARLLLTSSQAELEEGVLQMTLLQSSGEQHISDTFFFFIGLARISCARAKTIHDFLNWLFSRS